MGRTDSPPPTRSPLPELSSISSALDDITLRVTSIAEDATGEEGEKLASQLFQVERALTDARRRLGVIMGS